MDTKRGYALFWNVDSAVKYFFGNLKIRTLNAVNNFSSIFWGWPCPHISEIPDRPFIIVRKGEWLNEGRHTEFSVQYETEDCKIYG